MLAFSYPSPNGDELRQRIGSIDFLGEPYGGPRDHPDQGEPGVDSASS